MRRVRRVVVAAVLGALLGAPLAACSGGGEESGSSGPPSASASSDPVGSSPEPTTPDPTPPDPTPTDPGDAPSSSSSPSSTEEPPADAMRLLAVGDSVTTGFNSCEPARRCPEETWLTADGGVLDLLAAAGEPAVDVVAAHEGARVRDAAELVELALAEQPGPVDAVVLLLGANDQCATSTAALEPLPDVAASLTALLARLAEIAPGAPLVLGSPLDVPQVVDTVGEDPTAALIWGFGICETVLGVEADVEAARVRHAELVTVFEQVCAAQPQCRWDGGAVAGAVMEASELSRFDYFHPSRTGQVRLAETLWPTLSQSLGLG